jgi:hypothetical protein
MTLRRGFYATRVDLEPGLRAFEAATPVTYVRAGYFDSAEPRRVASALDLSLGNAPTGAMMTEERYLVLPPGAALQVRPVPQRSGGTRFAIDQLLNPDSVVCCFGGVHGERVLISGEISTIAASEASRALFKSIARSLLRRFEHVGSYWVGCEARKMLDAGSRLTFSVKSPVEYDLRRVPAN